MTTATDETVADQPMLSIGKAAEQAGVSERALRYYQQLGLITPTCTSGGCRRYTGTDLARVARIRELQTLLGLNLEEIATVLRYEDRVAQIRAAYHDRRTGLAKRQQLLRESLAIHEGLRDTVQGKKAALETFLTDLDARIEKIHNALS